MAATLEALPGLMRKLIIQIPAEKVQIEYDKRIQNLSKRAKIDGFRPGKVPVKIIDRRYGDSILNEMVPELINEQLVATIQEKKLRLVGRPTITEIKADKNQPIEFQAEFEILPDIQLQSLTETKIEQVSGEISEADIDKELETIRESNKEWIEISEAAQDNHQVTLTYEAFKAGQPFEVISHQEKSDEPQQMAVVLGEEGIPEDLQNALQGVKAGDEKTVTVTYPKETPPPLSGETLEFKIKVKRISSAKLPELDDVFANELGYENGLEGLREELKQTLTNEMQKTINFINQQEIFEKFLELHDEVELPKSLVDQETHYINQQFEQTATQQFELSSEDKQALEETAKKRVQLGLLIGQYANANQMVANEDKVWEEVQLVASRYHNPTEIARWFYEDENRLNQIKSRVLEGQVAEHLRKSAIIIDKKLSYDELLMRQLKILEQQV